MPLGLPERNSSMAPLVGYRRLHKELPSRVRRIVKTDIGFFSLGSQLIRFIRRTDDYSINYLTAPNSKICAPRCVLERSILSKPSWRDMPENIKGKVFIPIQGCIRTDG